MSVENAFDYQALLQQIDQWFPIVFPCLALIGGIGIALKLASFLLKEFTDAFPIETEKAKNDQAAASWTLEKPKHEAGDHLVEMDFDDDKPKRREPYMTIGDDGELVEMEE